MNSQNTEIMKDLIIHSKEPQVCALVIDKIRRDIDEFIYDSINCNIKWHIFDAVIEELK